MPVHGAYTRPKSMITTVLPQSPRLRMFRSKETRHGTRRSARRGRRRARGAGAVVATWAGWGRPLSADTGARSRRIRAPALGGYGRPLSADTGGNSGENG